MKQHPRRLFFISILVSTLSLKSASKKCPKRSVRTQCVSMFVFFFFLVFVFVFFWRASFLLVVIFTDLRVYLFIHLNGTVLFVAEVGAEKVSLVSIK